MPDYDALWTNKKGDKYDALWDEKPKPSRAPVSFDEQGFQTGIRATPWFKQFKAKYHEEPNLNNPADYDYRKAWKMGIRPKWQPEHGEYRWDDVAKGPANPHGGLRGQGKYADTFVVKPSRALGKSIPTPGWVKTIAAGYRPPSSSIEAEVGRAKQYYGSPTNMQFEQQGRYVSEPLTGNEPLFERLLRGSEQLGGAILPAGRIGQVAAAVAQPGAIPGMIKGMAQPVIHPITEFKRDPVNTLATWLMFAGGVAGAKSALRRRATPAVERIEAAPGVTKRPVVQWEPAKVLANAEKKFPAKHPITSYESALAWVEKNKQSHLESGVRNPEQSLAKLQDILRRAIEVEEQDAYAPILRQTIREVENEKWEQVFLGPPKPISGLQIRTRVIARGHLAGKEVWSKAGATGYDLDDLVSQVASSEHPGATGQLEQGISHEQHQAIIDSLSERIKENAPHDRPSRIALPGRMPEVRDFGELSGSYITKAEMDALIKSTGGALRPWRKPVIGAKAVRVTRNVPKPGSVIPLAESPDVFKNIPKEPRVPKGKGPPTTPVEAPVAPVETGAAEVAGQTPKELWQISSKEPWQMTADEYWTTTSPVDNTRRIPGWDAPHEIVVEAALSEGKPVPSVVVDEFLANGGKLPATGLHPDLAAKYRTPARASIRLGNAENAAIAKAAKAKVESGALKSEGAPPTKLYAGLDPREGVRLADQVDIAPNPRAPGQFKVERPLQKGRDYDLRDRLAQPLGIYDPTGSPIQKGVYDRLGEVVRENGIVENVGHNAGLAIRGAERTITVGVHEAGKALDHIAELVTSTVPRSLNPFRNKRMVDKAFTDFVDVIEKPLGDPSRLAVESSGTPVGEALKLHDQMTNQFRDYIIESRRKLGIETPNDWGITDKGYFRHLFLGDIQIFKNGDFIGVAPTYAEAQKMAYDVLTKEPDANLTAKARNTFFGDPTTRISTRKFFKLVGDIAEETTLSKQDIMEDLRGKVGRQSMRQKWAGYVLHRKGTPGFSKAYLDVMRIHAAQVYRTQELSKLNRAITPMMEDLRRNGKPGLADAVKEHMDALWGTPTKFEKDFGNLVRNTPVLRNHVANPDMAFRMLARKLTGLQMALKLKVSPRSALVNLLQPFSTLWPYAETTEFAGIYKDFMKPSTRRMLAERGVLDSSSKLETSGVGVRRQTPSPLNPANWFQNASEVNRGVGYLFGQRRALKLGMTPEQAHNYGLSWAEKVEFDNSQWNIQAVLRSPQGRVLGQFKSFAGKNLENVRDVFAPENVSRPQRAARIGKWGAAQLGIGGVKSLGLAAKVVGGYKIVKFLSDQLHQTGMKQEDADKWAHAAYYGAPSLVGQDLSASVAILEEPYGWTAMEKAANFVFGPTVTGALKIGEAIGKRDYEDVAKALTPAFKIYDVARQAGRTQRVKVGSNQYVNLTPFEAVMRALGFTPLKVSEVYDKKDAGIKTRRGGTYSYRR